MKTELKIILLSAAAGFSTWWIDAVLDFLVFPSGKSFPDVLLFSLTLSELYFRVIIILVSVVFGLLLSRYFARARRGEEIQRQSEEKYRTLVENMQDGIFIIQDTRLRFVNRALAAMAGCSPEEIIGRDFQQMVAPEDLETVRSRYTKRLAGEEVPNEYELRLLHKDRHTRILVHIVVGLIPYQGGVATMGTVKDITRQRQIEESLKQSKDFLEKIMDNVTDALYVLDLGGRFALANRRTSEITGYSHEELAGKHLSLIISPGLLPDVQQHFIDVSVHGMTVSQQETEIVRKDGAKRTIAYSAAPLLFDGRITSIICSAEDITDRKRAGEELRKLSTAVEWTADSIVITDRNGLIEYVNPAFEANTGYTREEAIGKTPNILKSGEHDVPFYKNLWDEILAGRVFRSVFVNKKKNGELFYDEHTITPIRDSSGVITHYVSTSKDITERIRAEEKLRELAERDPLTDIYNRRKFFDLLRGGVEQARRYGRPLSLLLFDIDHFKQVNDTYGHDRGDVVLKTLARVVEKSIRKADIFARYGGEEFTLFAPETALQGALDLAEKIRQTIESHSFSQAGGITVSIGVTELEEGDSMDSLVRRADSALYLAK
ncbi:MAG: PAS domain S-box protein, partial [Nitrospirales bacterium]|nr:PAS domain S-box protein [Nitrospirales bacterium]